MLSTHYALVGSYSRRLLWFQGLSAFSTLLVFTYLWVVRNTISRSEAYIIAIAVGFMGIGSFQRLLKYRKRFEVAFTPEGLFLRGYPIRRSAKIRILRRVSPTELVLVFNALYVLSVNGSRAEVDALIKELSALPRDMIQSQYQI